MISIDISISREECCCNGDNQSTAKICLVFIIVTNVIDIIIVIDPKETNKIIIEYGCCKVEDRELLKLHSALLCFTLLYSTLLH